MTLENTTNKTWKREESHEFGVRRGLTLKYVNNTLQFDTGNIKK